MWIFLGEASFWLFWEYAYLESTSDVSVLKGCNPVTRLSYARETLLQSYKEQTNVYNAREIMQHTKIRL